MSNAAAAYEAINARVGHDEATGDWFQITQEQINAFADCTHDPSSSIPIRSGRPRSSAARSPTVSSPSRCW